MNARTQSARTDRPGMVAPDIAGLEPLRTIRSRWPMAMGGLLTVAMIAGLLRELLASGLSGLGRIVPGSPLFYLFFVLLYLSPITGDTIIFRRLWGIPFAGFVALIKKRIANEVVFGYSGEAYFYAWARSRATMVAAPFGAVKDVSILSAIAGNGMTLAMVAVAVPLGHALLPPDMLRPIGGSVAVTAAISLPFLLFSRRVFSQPWRTLWWIFGVHWVRLLVGQVLIALAWHFALPGVSMGLWLLLAAGRMLVSRLPLVPNKDVLFANLAIVAIGRDTALSDLMAFSAALTVLLHLVLIGLFSVQAVVARNAG
ncbi:hypothetical protein [Sphingomonas bacterium]|uniref:hypothetical protein n=1 Tax=Sphingomonas bacterium TaxID=1895847 RepID=UPI00157551B1|nr:hypothetical protein [Sphingomonas bacterium]